MTSKKISEEKRLQALRNMIPKEIVKLIISFVNYRPTFQAIYNKIHIHYPFTGYYKYYFNFDPFYYKGDFVRAFEWIGNTVQNNPIIDVQNYDHYEELQRCIEDIRDYFRDLRHDTKNVFYTKNIKGRFIVGGSDMYYRFVQEIYTALKPNFLMEKAQTPLKFNKEYNGYPLLNFKINANGVEGKKAVSNFFNGIGQTIQWMKYEAIPILKVEPKNNKLFL